MKLLLDTCVWGGAKKTLESFGHDVIWTGNWSKDPGDEEILATANNEGRILVTLDKDFGEIAIVKGKPHAGILRSVNLSANQQGIVCQRVIEAYGQVLQSGAIVTVEPGRIRMRPPGPLTKTNRINNKPENKKAGHSNRVISGFTFSRLPHTAYRILLPPVSMLHNPIVTIKFMNHFKKISVSISISKEQTLVTASLTLLPPLRPLNIV